MSRYLTVLSLATVAFLVGPVLMPEPVHAGCVVLENGEVLALQVLHQRLYQVGPAIGLSSKHDRYQLQACEFGRP